MKVVERGAADSALSAGDRITVSVSHQIRISGDESWVKYEVNTAVRDEETTQQAKTRAIGHVTAAVMEAVHTTVDTVREATS
jgi:hypothetical protein